jgi:hypothetical protein
MGYISIRVADFDVGSPDLTQPSFTWALDYTNLLEMLLLLYA